MLQRLPPLVLRSSSQSVDVAPGRGPSYSILVDRQSCVPSTSRSSPSLSSANQQQNRRPVVNFLEHDENTPKRTLGHVWLHRREPPRTHSTRRLVFLLTCDSRDDDFASKSTIPHNPLPKHCRPTNSRRRHAPNPSDEELGLSIIDNVHY